MFELTRRCEEDVQAMIEAGTESPDWVRYEFAGVKLGDKRLDRRLIKTVELLAKSPLSPINEACGCWADTQAAYRLFDNVKADPAEILEPHITATRKRVAAVSGPVLVIQDTVFFDYTNHPKTRGLGLVGERGERGLIMHNAMAFTTSGLPLGLLSQNTWARPRMPEQETPTRRVRRLARTPIEEKESFKWVRAMNETLEHCPARSKLITVADRESDIFEVLTEAKNLRTHFIIRARCDRRLTPEENEGYESIIETLNSTEVLGTMTVDIPSSGKRKGRTAELDVRATQVTIDPPDRRRSGTAGKEWAMMDPISLKVIGASERNAPVGEEAISWVLLTDLPALDVDNAKEKVNWYAKRFGIEIWHKVLKSGCKVESCLLETAERLMRYLTVFSIIGVRLMHVCHLARVQPDIPATEVFSRKEIEALHVRVNRKLPPPEPLTLKEVVRMIGSLGGHLGRKCDKEPGVTVLWRGWMRLHEDVLVLGAHKQALGLSDTS